MSDILLLYVSLICYSSILLLYVIGGSLGQLHAFCTCANETHANVTHANVTHANVTHAR